MVELLLIVGLVGFFALSFVLVKGIERMMD